MSQRLDECPNCTAGNRSHNGSYCSNCGEPLFTDDLRDPRSDLPSTLLRTVGGAEHKQEAARARDKTRRIVRQLELQDWLCAYPCAGDGRTGRPILPGEPIAHIYDGHGICHLECARIGIAPATGNPYSKPFVVRRESE